VVLTSDDGLRLETTVLRWHGADRRLWTDAPVRIVQGSAVIDGKALDVKMADEVATITGRVRAVFDTRRGGDAK
jgi:lipopolysaccharide export system protein LptC